MKAHNSTHDIVIIGAGPVGLIQTILLAQNGVKVLCLDKQSEKDFIASPLSQRTTAISYGSRQILKAAHLWEEVIKESCAIQSIHVLDGSSPILLNFNFADDTQAHEAEGLGWVIENRKLRSILLHTIKNIPNAIYRDDCGIKSFNQNSDTVIVQTTDNNIFHSTLLIGADGRNSMVRKTCNIETEEHDYKQRAIISIITHEKPHQNIAIEHFRKSGPFAILPMNNDTQGHHLSSIVWTEESYNKNSIMDYNDETFLVALKELFPSHYSDILHATKRFAYPLGYIHAFDYVAKRVALIGDAAHGIHPIAGQGLNLGLRDVAALTEIILKYKNEDIGSDKILNEYQEKRRADNHLMSAAVHHLNQLFSNESKLIKGIRIGGLKIIDKIKPVKKRVLSHAMGTAGHLPELIKKGKI